MSNTWTIADREFRGYFNSPVAYIVLGLVLLALGIFFWQDFFLIGRAQVRDLFATLSWLLVIAAPAMTMGLLAEEKRTGTIEVLLTMPVRDAEVVLGKFLGVVLLYGVLLLLTLPYPLSVSTLGPLDWGTVWAGYLGIFLQGSAMLALGLMASSFTSNQLVAFFVGLVLCGLLWLVDFFLPFLPSQVASVAQWVSLRHHFTSMARGVVDSRDLVYFLSVGVFSLALAFRSLESRRWR